MRAGTPAILSAVALGASLACVPVSAQVSDLLRFLSPASAPASSASVTQLAGDKGLMPVKPKANVTDELAADKLCKHVEEKTDVWEKLADYGGTEAQLRMQRLLSSDFKYSDLTPDDRNMLRYIAYTTIWVPPSVEGGIGKLYATYLRPSSNAEESQSRSEKSQMQRQDEQLQAFRSTIPDFPGDAILVLDTAASTGASARPGGLILLSRDFVNRMDESAPVQHLVLAHELSHLYKRHTIKELQFKLITSSAGFELGRRLLRRSLPTGSGNVFDMAKGMLDTMTLARDLMEFVKSTQTTYQVNQELEADACSVEWMKRSHLDPRELWQAFGELDKVSPADDSSYVYTHPTTEERRRNIELAARAQSGKPAKGASKPAKPAKTGEPG